MSSIEIDFTTWSESELKSFNKNPNNPVKVCRKCRCILTETNWSINLNTTNRPHESYCCNECTLSNLRDNRKKKRDRVLKEYGEVCVCCGLTEYDLLDIDHINNDGCHERREVTDMVNWIIKQNFPKDKYQILCKNCNRTKMMLKGQPCNCKLPESRILVPQTFTRPKKYLNVKFQPFDTKKCTDCNIHLNETNYKKISNGHSLKYLCRDCVLNRNAQYTLARRKKVLDAYGCKCSMCGYDGYLAIEIDHIYNDGRQERKEKKIKDFYRYLIQNNYPKDRYQLLCANCNYIKQKGLKKAKRLKK